jgi:hypothetical protein
MRLMQLMQLMRVMSCLFHAKGRTSARDLKVATTLRVSKEHDVVHTTSRVLSFVPNVTLGIQKLMERALNAME